MSWRVGVLRGAPPVGLTSKQAASVCASRVREGILFARLSFPVPGKSEMGLDGRTDGRSDLTRRCLLVGVCVCARSQCLSLAVDVRVSRRCVCVPWHAYL